jgi:flavodoxin
MKILIVYYSKTGNTKKIAKEIAKNLNADLDEIKDLQYQGWNVLGKVMFKKETKIKYKKNPLKYDLVIVGTPVWAWNITPPVRTYLNKNKSKIKKVAFFCTYGGNSGKTFESMEKLSKKPLAILKLKFKQFQKREINSGDMKEIKKFCKKVK